MKNPRLTYCTNVHPLGDWASWSEIIGRFGPAIASELGRLGWTSQPMGLWFPAALIEEMNRDPHGSRDRLLSLLSEKRLSTFTCNAFPYGNFHEKVVKTKVYRPDWTTPERLAYTVACARLLAALVPVGGDGSVSTLPLGWRIGWSEAQSRRSAENLCIFVREARDLREVQGRTIRLGLEPEPGCALETLDQVLGFWDLHLRPAAARAGLSPEDLAEFCGLCYDTCHQAVQFEDALEVLDRLQANGIRIVKMQLSSALELKPDPERTTLALRRQFVEARFLHQTRVKTPAGLVSFDDLPEILAGSGRVLADNTSGDEAGSEIDLWDHPWRVHFHLPIDSHSLLDSTGIGTTRDEMLKAFRHALARDLCRHFEVETYTWNVLPEAHRPKDDTELARSIARELAFIASHAPPGTKFNADA